VVFPARHKAPPSARRRCRSAPPRARSKRRGQRRTDGEGDATSSRCAPNVKSLSRGPFAKTPPNRKPQQQCVGVEPLCVHRRPDSVESRWGRGPYPALGDTYYVLARFFVAGESLRG